MIKAQRGTKDILPDEILTWQSVYKKACELFKNANCREIRTPVFEATELFKRGVGDSTDIVNKEMYTFLTGGNETSLTLRPENTAGIVRAFIEHGMDRLSPPVKLWYMGPMFRYERPQAGRQRQFHQIGVEIFGISEALADAETIILASELLKMNGIEGLTVSLNSLGCPKCRNIYKEEIKKAIEPYLDKLCDDCKIRFQKNPLRMLDCKDENCQKIFEKEEIKSVILKDFICDDCKNHFEEVKKYLKCANIGFEHDKMLVRGLDYYTRTVFEIKSNLLGAQSAILGGGRYDGLVEMLGGKPTPAVGFALGVERLMGLIKKVEEEKLNYYIVTKFGEEAVKLALKLRQKGLRVDFDMQQRKFAKQLEKASKIAKKAIIIGEDELSGKFFTVKDLETGEQIKTYEP